MKYFEPSSNSNGHLPPSQRNQVISTFISCDLTKEHRLSKECLRYAPDEGSWLRWLLDLVPYAARRRIDEMVYGLKIRKGFFGSLTRLVLKIVALLQAVKNAYRRLLPFSSRIKIVEWCAHPGDTITRAQPVFKYVKVSRIFRLPLSCVHQFHFEQNAYFARPLMEIGQRVKPNQAVFSFVPVEALNIVEQVAAASPVVSEARSIVEAFTAKIYQLSLAKILPVICERLENLPPNPPDDDESAIVLLCRTVYRLFGMGQGGTSRQVAEIAEQARKIKNDPDIDERLKRQLIAKLEQQIHAIP